MIGVGVYVDFTRGGAWVDVSADVVEARWSIGARAANQLMANAGRATIRLNDEDGDYNPDNAAGPYYGLFAPRLPVKITTTAGGIERVMFLGYLEALRRPFDLVTGARFTELVAGDIFGVLRDAVVELPLMVDARSDEIVEAILTRVELPPAAGTGWRLGVEGLSNLGVSTVLGDASAGFDLDEGVLVAPYAGDNWAGGVTALAAITSVVEAERGRFYFGRDGVAVFKNRRYIPTITSTVATITAAAGASRSYFDDLKTSVKVNLEPRKIETGVTLFELNEPIVCAAGAVTEFKARFSNDTGVEVAARNLVTPNTGDGSLVYTGGAVAISMTGSAKSAAFTFDNPNSTDTTITALTIVGDRLTSFDVLEAVAEDDEAVALYGRRELVVDGRLMTDLGDAQQVADYELGRLGTPRGYTTKITLMGDEAEDNMGLTVMDAIELSGVYPGVDETAVIVGEAHNWRASSGGADYRAELFLESRDFGQLWLLGVDGYSNLGVSTRLGF